MVPHILLEEINAEYKRILVDTGKQVNRQPDFLRLNPNGHVPVLIHGDLVLYETAAITLHLCDNFVNPSLLPSFGTHQRAHFYKWLIWLTNTLQATLIVYFYAHRWIDEGDEAGVAALQRKAEQKVDGMLTQLDEEICRNNGSWFLGENYTALDAYVFTLSRWTRNFQRTSPASKRPYLGPYLQRMLERSAVQRVLVNEELNPPYV